MVRGGGEDPELVGREGQKRTGQPGVSRSVCWKVGARAQTCTITDADFPLVLQKVCMKLIPCSETPTPMGPDPPPLPFFTGEAHVFKDCTPGATGQSLPLIPAAVEPPPR